MVQVFVKLMITILGKWNFLKQCIIASYFEKGGFKTKIGSNLKNKDYIKLLTQME